MTQLRAIALSSLFMLAGIAGCSSYGYRGDVKGDDVGGVWHVVSLTPPEQGVVGETFLMLGRSFDVELSAEPCVQPATIMRIWSASAVARYYLDPAIKFLRAENHGAGKPTAAGYYIVPHCSPDCCRAFGGVSLGDLGPFPTRTKARRWSRTYLTEPGGTAH